MSSAETSDVARPDIPQPNKCVAIIDPLTDVLSMDKPSWIKTCKDVSAHFIAYLHRKCDAYDELHIVFDTYDIPEPLKSATMHVSLGDSYSVAYHITDTRNYFNCSTDETVIPHSKKDELTVFCQKNCRILKREQSVYHCMAK